MKHQGIVVPLGIAVLVLLLARPLMVGAEERKPIRTEKLTDFVTLLIYAEGHPELEISDSPWALVSAKNGRVTLIPPYTLPTIPPYTPPGEEPTPRVVDTARGYITFSPAGRRAVLPQYRPSDSELTDEVSIFASPGEFEQATFALRPLVELGIVRCDVGDLRGPNGATIPASSMDVYIVEPTVEQVDFARSQHPGHGEMVRWVAKWLRPGNTADTTIARNTQVYLDVHVPAEARPGHYVGTIAIRPEKGKASSFTVRLEVLPLVLSRPMAWGLFGYGETVLRPRWLKEMRRTGMTQMVISRTSRNPIVQPDGTIDLSQYDESIEAYREAGFEDPPILSMEALFSSTIGVEEVPAEKREFMGQVIRRIYEHSLKAKWPPYYVYFVDEPGPGTVRLERLKYMCGLAREFAPGMQTAGTVAGNPETWYRDYLGNLLDLNICCLWAYVNPVHSADGNRRWQRLAARERMKLYGYGFWAQDHQMDTYWENRHITFRAEKAGLEGMMTWVQEFAFDEEEPFSPYRFVLRAKNGPLCMFYPDGSVWRSLSLIGIREGIDDSRYVRTLRKLIADARSAGRYREAASGRRCLQRVLDEIPWGGRVSPGWTAIDADAARWELAQAAVECQRALEE